ncbi:MAG: glycosyltransferase family 2 protein [Candidatus Cryptobacteroides sp.]
MQQKVLSIIVPTYNMERYLSYCLDSFLVQKNRERIEVIIVNDGSTDCSLEIAKGYAARFPDVYKIIDKKNGNYGSCINAALLTATAEYVKVVDADDSVDTFNLDLFINFLRDNRLDLALSDFTWVDTERNKLKETTYLLGKTILTIEEACIQEAFKNMEMHAVTYRKKMLIDAGYRQTEGISYTDQQWIFAPMANVRQVGVFNAPVYQYMVGRAGQTIDEEVKLRRMKDRVSYVMDMIKQYDTLYSRSSKEVKGYLDARIYPNIKDIYVSYFTHYQKIDRGLIHSFDINFLEASKLLYHELGHSNRYIEIWRSLKNRRMQESVFCEIFSLMFYLKSLNR